MQIVWNAKVFGNQLKQAVSDATPRQPLRVMVVDDCRDYAQSISMICRFWGHPTECCFDGAAALLAAQAFDPQVFLIDVAMPRISGYELVAALRKIPLFEAALFIGVSGYADEAHRTRGLSSGFDHYLVKPVDFSELQRLLADRISQLPAPALPVRAVTARPLGAAAI